MRVTFWSIALGVAIGVLSRIGDNLPPGLNWPLNLASVWLAAAFGIGALTHRTRAGALAGVASLVVAVLAYYGVMRIIESGVNLSYALRIVVPWLVLAVPGGLIWGALGAVWRTRSDIWRTVSVALLSGVVIGETTFLVAWASRSSAEMLTLGTIFLIGLSLPLLLLSQLHERFHAWSIASIVALASLGMVPLIRWTFQYADRIAP